ncbi:putative ABC transport system permease protein [Luteibacter sp. Sphag1AF]|uniref:ABC transporter permease n=1 Tax=Luteibacter sp. Sphag1AF TaxID=2587031 RepID=UPI00160CDD3D|nr:FtsX-like permease family protein [Luteibacter sp. Sphag1AF]MBB3227325.1 putative ABC transport system permease protein [Luteibacter sp. Sphag1AF]
MEIRPILSTLRRHKVTATLVILEIALTCAIVCNAIFLIGQRLDHIDLPSGVAESELMQIIPVGIGKQADSHARATADLAALRQIPGVTGATMANQLPFGNQSWNSSIRLSPDQKLPSLNSTIYYGQDVVRIYGLDLIAGRNFQDDEYKWWDDTAGDDSLSPHVGIVTQALARKLFPNENPLGKTIWQGTNNIQIIGVVRTLTRPNLRDVESNGYSIIMPLRVTMGNFAGFVLRSRPQDRARVLDEAVATLRKQDPRRVFTEKRTYDEIRKKFFAGDRSMTVLLATVCAALLIVTALGIVGLGSFWVAQRRRQIGVRRALGARRIDIVRYFQTENFLLATIGIALGMVLAYGINLLLMVHYELPRLPFIYLPAGAALLWLLGQAAVLGPALRAASVPPVVATRG